MAIVRDLSGNSVVGVVEHIPSLSELELWAVTDPVINTQKFGPVRENIAIRFTLVADRPVKWSAGESMAAGAALAYDNTQFRTTNDLVLAAPDFETDPSITVDIDLTDEYGNTSSIAFEIPVLQDTTEVPLAFTVGQWTLTDNGDGTGLTISISALPSDEGSVITDLEYKVGNGEWTSLEAATVGDYVIALDVGVEYNVLIRAVNANGAGPDSDLKAETPTAT